MSPRPAKKPLGNFYERMSGVEKHIATISKNRVEEIRISLSEYLGHDLINLRTFATVDATSERVPTRKGLAFKVALLPEVIKGLRQAEAEAQAAGLLAAKTESAA